VADEKWDEQEKNKEAARRRRRRRRRRRSRRRSIGGRTREVAVSTLRIKVHASVPKARSRTPHFSQ
jgi:hypothetical protein